MSKDKRVKKNLKKIKSAINYIVQSLATICTITGVSIYSAIDIMSKELDVSKTKSNNMVSPYIKLINDSFIRHFWIIMSISFLIVLIINGLIIPLYKIYRKDVPKEEAKPSPMGIWLYSFLCAFFLIGSLFSTVYARDKTEKNIQIIIENIPISYENDDSNQENCLMISKEIINEYIIRSKEEIIPIEELDLLSNDELYYLRNGIYAYSGMYFEEDYYIDFSWYNGIYSEEEAAKHINSIQWKNINNIKAIEKQRSMMKRAEN